MIDLTYLTLFLIALMLIPVIISNKIIGLNINKSIIISLLRMLIQLFLVGLYLKYIFLWNNPFVNIAYLGIMITVASIHSIGSSSLKLKRFILPILVAVAIPQFLVILTFNFLVAGKAGIFNADLIIPIGGMILGNCLNGNIVALDSFYSGISKNRQEYEYTLTLGASHIESLLPFIRKSMELSIKPSIASMATTGLVSLPGMMTGQILAGASPVTAIKYQVAILIAILTAKYFSTLFSLLFSLRVAFTPELTLK